MEINSEKVSDMLGQIGDECMSIAPGDNTPFYVINDKLYSAIFRVRDLIRLVDSETAN